MHIKIFSCVVLASLGLALTAFHLQAGDTSIAALIESKRVFNTPISWVGNIAPGEDESQALLKKIQLFEAGDSQGGFAGLEAYLTKYPHSAWSPALEVNLAEYYRIHGRYIEALAHWKSSWTELKGNKDTVSQKMGARAIAGWTRLLGSLGEKEQLKALFAEVEALELPLGAYAATIEETKEGLGMMNSKPGASYRCGSFALGHMALALGIDKKVSLKMFDVDSPDGGFHLSELLALAETNGLAVGAVRKPVGAELVVPSVVHWKLNHYAAITEKKGDLYKVIDPTFNGHVWLDAGTIESESSGEFIVPKEKIPHSWVALSESECAVIYGKGYPNVINDGNDFTPPPHCEDDGTDGDGDSSESTGDAPETKDGGEAKSNIAADAKSSAGGALDNMVENRAIIPGMPQWSVSEPYISLWVQDTPLLYQRSSGAWVTLNMAYQSRGGSQNSMAGGFGDKWACDFVGMLQSQSTNSDEVVDFRAGGGQEVFQTDGTPSYETARVYRMMNVAGINEPALVTPHGSANVYGLAVNDMTGTTNNYLTERLDRFGRVIEQFGYQTNGGVVLLTNMTDLDGRSMSFAYGNVTYSNLITTVTDPYGRTAHFNYDSTGLLTNIVDAQGMSTWFQYDSDEEITNMVTPYGTNRFQYFHGLDSNGGLERGLLITEASGDHQAYSYQDDALTNTYSGLFSPYDGSAGLRLSFHWNRLQFTTVSSAGQTNLFAMTANDYNNASLKHWLHGDPTTGMETVCDSMDSSADPVDPTAGYRLNEKQYTYFGEVSPHIGDGTDPQLKCVTGYYLYTYDLAVQKNYNSLGLSTNIIIYNDYGSPTSYTNNYDSSGTILQSVYGPRGELVYGYGYDSVHSNLLVSVTNAVGDVTRYTYNTNTLKVTSVVFPGGLVRTNIYYTSGLSAGFLQQQIDVGIRTNAFSYTNGNLAVLTNELGLVTVYTYDSLNRLLSTGYPDGSTVSNVFNKLDVVATKDRLNQWSYYGYNAVRQMVAETNVNGQVTTYDYCGCGSPDQIIRWNGSTPVAILFYHNISGLVTNVVCPDLYQLYYTYDALNRVSVKKDVAGNTQEFDYELHGLNSLVNAEYLGGQQLLAEKFDEYGRTTNSVDRNNVATAIGYDFLGRMVSRQTFSGFYDGTLSGQEIFSYGPLGMTNYLDARGYTTTYGYDAAGRMMAQTNANSEVIQYTYNPASQVITLSDGKSQTTTWAYDSFGRVTNKLDANGTNILAYAYDANSRLTNRWSVAKGSTHYLYDPLGNLTNVVYPVSSNIILAYDLLNRLTNMVDGVGSTTFSWTDGGQLAGENGPWAADAINYVYNSARQRASLSLTQPNASAWQQSYTYDSVMRLTNVTSQAGTFQYIFNSGGNQVQYMYYPWSPYSVAIANNYDGMARLTSSTLNTPLATTASQFKYAYDSGSQRTQQVYTAGNYINYNYDSIGQIKSANGLESDGVTPRLQEQFGYTYDAARNLRARTNNALIQGFGVNNLNELANSTRSGTLTVAGTATEVRGSIYGYPPGVTNVTVSGTGLSGGLANLYSDGTWAVGGASLANGTNSYLAVAQDTYGRGDTNSISVNLPATNNYSYDLNGNLLSDGARYFAYDDENHLISVWATNNWRIDFVYDGMMRRRIERDYGWRGSAWTQTNEVHFVYDGKLVIQERDGANLPLVSYTRGNDRSGTFQQAGGVGGLLARTANSSLILGSSVSHSYYFFDGNGNVAGLVNTNGLIVARYSYDPFGNILLMSGPLASANIYRFSSKEWCANLGMYYYIYRYYDPNSQHWLNSDPSQEWGGYNLFGFCLNNPIEYIDRDGLGAGSITIPIIIESGGAGTIAVSGGGIAVIGTAAAGTIIGIVPILFPPPSPIVYPPTYPGDINSPPQNITYIPGTPPWPGPPNETVVGPNQSTTYGPDGYPVIQRDPPHHGKGDHCHDWGRPADGGPPESPPGQTKNPYRGPGRDPRPGDPPKPTGSKS